MAQFIETVIGMAVSGLFVTGVIIAVAPLV